MAGVLEQATLPELLNAADTIADDVRTTFGSLTPEQLNWKPTPKAWSVGQCLDHLIESNTKYFPTFEAIAEGRRRRRLWERVPGLPGVFGKMLVGSVGPEMRRTLPAPAIFVPTQSDVDPGIVERFAEHQRTATGLMRRTEHLDLDREIIASPVSGLITLSLMNAYRVLVRHELRHVAQAKRVMGMEGFPKG